MTLPALDGRSALAKLRALQRRAYLRKVVANLKRPKTALLALLGIALVALIIWANSRHAIGGENGLLYVSTGLVALTLLTLVAGASNGAVFFRPSEVHFLFPGPLTTRDLLEHHLIAASIRAALSVVIFVAFLRLGDVAPWRLFIAYALAFVLMTALQTRVDLAHQHLPPSRRKARGRWLAFTSFALIGLLIGLAWWNDGQTMSADVLRYVAAPAKPLAWIMAGPPGLALGGAAIIIAGTAVAARSVLRHEGDIRESALATSERFSKMVKQAQAGKIPTAGSRAKEAKGRTLRMLPRLGGAGVFAWRQLVALKRARMTYGMLLYMVVVGGTVSAFVVDERRLEGLAASMLSILGLAGPMYVRCDFRDDTEKYAFLRSLPASPTTIAWGQMLPSAFVISVLQWVLCGWAIVLVEPTWWPAVILALLTLPLLNLWQLTVWNGAHLLAPSKLVSSDGQASLTQIARQSLVMMALFFILGVTSIPLLIGGGLGYLLGDMLFATNAVAAIPAVLGGAVVLAAQVSMLVWIVGRLFVRADP